MGLDSCRAWWRRQNPRFSAWKPFVLTLIKIVFPISCIVSVVAFGFREWRSAAPTLAIILAYTVTNSLVIRRYERTGQAVRRRRVNVRVRFPEGFPKPLLAARSAFFIVVVLMLVLGIGPFVFAGAKMGIIGCVFGLVGVAALNVLL